MKVKYEVYQREGVIASMPIVTYQGEPINSLRYKRRYTGKKAKAEALMRFLGHKFANDVSTAEVDAFIKENLFGTSSWKAYHEVFQNVANETEVLIDKYVFLYYLDVELDNISADSDDGRLIYIINQELIGQRVPEYKGLINPVRSISISDK